MMNEPLDTDKIRETMTWRIGMWLNGIVAGDHEWGERRMFLMAVLVVAFTLMGRAVDPVIPEKVCVPSILGWLFKSDEPEQALTEFVPVGSKGGFGIVFEGEGQQTAPPDTETQPASSSLPCLSDITGDMSPLMTQIVLLLLSPLLPHLWRHAIPPALAIYLTRRIGANYIRDLFELVDSQTAYNFLRPAISGQNYPKVRVTAQGFNVDENTSPLAKIGGPGYIHVANGNAAIFELHGGPSLVVGPGKHFIRQFEYLRDVIDLRDQYRKIDKIEAVTKDGIQVTIQNLEMAFRVRTSNRRRTRQDQYPFAVSAIRTLAYNRTIVWGQEDKTPSAWTDTIPQTIVGIIRRYINNTHLDHLIERDVDELDPRETIKQMLQSTETRNQFNEKGVDLLWVSLGHIDIPAEAKSQRIDTWKAEWEKEARLKLFESEAERLQMSEYSHALARLEVINKFASRMKAGEELSADMIVINLAQALESTSYQPKIPTTTFGKQKPSELLQFIEHMIEDTHLPDTGPLPLDITEEELRNQDVFDPESLAELGLMDEFEDLDDEQGMILDG